MIYSLQNAIPKELILKIKSGITDELLYSSDQLGGYNRVGKTVNISKTPELACLDSDLSLFIGNLVKKYINFRYAPSFATGDSGYEFHRYAPGDMCLVHTDGECDIVEGGNTGLLRYATIVLHLNTVHSGGKTVFPHQNKSFDTIEGQVLIFPPYNAYPHYVTPSDERRDIVMTWLVYTDINVIRTKQH